MKLISKYRLGLSLFALALIITVGGVYTRPFRILLNDDVSHPAPLDSLLRILDDEIDHHHLSIERKSRQIDQLHERQKTARTLTEKIELNHTLYQKYIYFEYDSATYYLDRNREIARFTNDTSLAISVEIERIHLLINYGLYWDASYSIYEVEAMPCDSLQFDRLHHNKMRLYYYMHKHLERNSSVNRYQRLFEQTRILLQQRTPDIQKLPWDIQYYIYEQQCPEEIPALITFLTHFAADSPYKERLYSLLYDWKADWAQRQGNPDEMRYYLTLAATSDLREVIANGHAIFLLAHEMLKAGDIERAQKYVKTCLDYTVILRSVINKSSMCEIIAEINACYLDRQKRHESQLISFIVLIGLLLLILTLLLLLLTREMHKKKRAQAELLSHHAQQVSLNKKLNELNLSLSHNNRIKEEYIGLFLGMRPYYIEKMELYRKEVVRFLKAGKIADLHAFCKKAHDDKDETELLHKEFDRMFLNIIPTFIDEFNSLLCEEARITPKPGELTIELRIFALIRLGIKDSAHIARYLRYSVNTIYSYRSRVKNGAIGNRDEFEGAVMEIGRENTGTSGDHYLNQKY